MPDTKISALPPAGPLVGTELIPMLQAGLDVAATPEQFAFFSNDGVTQKQMRQWAVDNGYIYTIDNAVDADIADPVNIAWLHGNSMQAGDALYLFIEATLGFTGTQMATAYAAMLTYPA